MSALAPTALGIVVVAALAFACGTEAVGVDACRTIENARCRRAPACGVDLSRPVRETGDDVQSCIRYYRDACLHGLASRNDPGALAVDACAAAIGTGPCTVVLAPETDPACSFLIPPPPAPPAAEAAAPVDAGAG